MLRIIDIISYKSIILIKLERFDEFLECFSKCFQIDVNYAPANCNKGTILRILYQREEVFKCVEKAIEINPNRSDFYLGKV